MISARFDVTAEIVTPESAADGDAADRYYVTKGATLRDAVAFVRATRTNAVEAAEVAECNEWPMVAPRWITIHNGLEYLTGATESRSLHLPDSLTPSTRRRIARLLGVRT